MGFKIQEAILITSCILESMTILANNFLKGIPVVNFNFLPSQWFSEVLVVECLFIDISQLG